MEAIVAFYFLEQYLRRLYSSSNSDALTNVAKILLKLS